MQYKEKIQNVAQYSLLQFVTIYNYDFLLKLQLIARNSNNLLQSINIELDCLKMVYN